MMKYRIVSIALSFFIPVLLLVVILAISLAHWGFGVNSSYDNFWGASFEWLFWGLLIIFVVSLPSLSGFLLARFMDLPPTLAGRLCPLFLPLFIGIALSIPLIWFWDLEVTLISLAVFSATYFIYIGTFCVTAWLRHVPMQKKMIGAGQLGAVFLLLFALMGYSFYSRSINTVTYDPSNQIIIGSFSENYYHPFQENNLLTLPDKQPVLRINSDHPRLDGTPELLPLYGAVAQTLYTDVETGYFYGDDTLEGHGELPYIGDLVSCKGEYYWLQGLIDGDVDISFGPLPARSVLDQLREAGLNPVVTPIAKDGFLFFTHVDNPVNDLSQKQIQAIYSGSIINWRQVRGSDEDILAFQLLDYYSDVQKFMEQVVMGGQAMKEPVNYFEYNRDSIAEYQNRPESIGYNFGWIINSQFINKDELKFFSVDGIAPTQRNITNGSYPFSRQLVAVTCRPLSARSQELLDWVLSPEGQALIAKTGYVPIKYSRQQ